MEAGIENHLWSIEEIVGSVAAYVQVRECLARGEKINALLAIRTETGGR
jgi:hypothetical protein